MSDDDNNAKKQQQQQIGECHFIMSGVLLKSSPMLMLLLLLQIQQLCWLPPKMRKISIGVHWNGFDNMDCRFDVSASTSGTAASQMDVTNNSPAAI
jgi:hypothetical protein